MARNVHMCLDVSIVHVNYNKDYDYDGHPNELTEQGELDINTNNFDDL